ncbi:Alpha-ketoglutarate-dependent dioxygenase alkB-like protein, partial [Stegodyphus mimosarum]
MSEDKRKNVRLQGRFSGGSEFLSDEKGKDKQKKEKKGRLSHPGDDEKSKVKQCANGSGARDKEISVQYQEKSNYHFPALESKKKTEEVRPGICVLSETENGISRIIYEPDFLSQEIADEYFEILFHATTWSDKKIVIKGEEITQPRLVAWYGPFPYAYSGAILEPAEMPPKVNEIRQMIERFLKANGRDVQFNSVLLNLYRNEKDSVAWHSDDELTMGVDPTIASVSLGAVRKFEMRSKKHLVTKQSLGDADYFVNLEHGSLLIMDGSVQLDWQHRVPKHFHSKEPRINLTFRTVFSIDESTPQQLKMPGRSKNINLQTLEKKSSMNKKQTCIQETCIDTEDTEVKKRNFINNNSIETSRKVEDLINDRSNLFEKWDSEKNSNCHEFSRVENVDQGLQMNFSHDNFLKQDNFNERKKDNILVQSDSFSERKVDEENENYDTGGIALSSGVSEMLDNGIRDNKQDFVATNTNIEERKKSDLNANAPDFIPSMWPMISFDGKSLMELVELSSSSSDIKLLTAILNKSYEKFDTNLFSNRDKEEIDFLKSISNPSQPEENQHLILKRLCHLIRRAHDRPNNMYPNVQNRYRSNSGYQSGQNTKYYNRPPRHR